jgi:excinuclease ABC subunit B
MAFNREHGIDPQTIRKSVTDILERLRGGAGGVGVGDGGGRATRAGRSRAEVRRNAAVRGNRRPAELLGEGDAATPAEAFELISQLEAEMKAAAAELRYEEAALLRDEIAELRASIPG